MSRKILSKLTEFIGSNIHVKLEFAAFLGFSILVWGLGILSVVIFYPVHFDEGYNLSVPSNFVQFGVYGSRTLEGFNWFDPFISTGPLVLLPVCASFMLMGKGVIQARVVPGFYAICVLVTLFSLSKRIYGSRVAATSVIVFTLIRNLFTILGTVLGEGAGSFLILAGILVWSYAEEKGCARTALLAGLFWGLSVWAKPSMMVAVVIITAIFAILFMVNASIGSRVVLSAISVAVAVGVVYFLLFWVLLHANPPSGLLLQQFKLQNLRTGQLLQNFVVFVRSTGLAIVLSIPITLSPLVRILVIRHKLGSGYNSASLPKSDPFYTAKVIITLLPAIWILWWLFFNGEANYRHLFPALVWGSISLSNALIHIDKKSFLKIMRVGLLILVLVNLFLPNGLIYHFSHLSNFCSDREAQIKFAQYIRRLDPKAHVKGIGWFMAWDISFLSERPFGVLDSRSISGPETYVIITPTIYHYPEEYLRAQRLIQMYSGTVVYEDSGYALFRLGAVP